MRISVPFATPSTVTNTTADSGARTSIRHCDNWDTRLSNRKLTSLRLAPSWMWPAITPRKRKKSVRERRSKYYDEVAIAHRKRPLGLFLSYFYNSHFDPSGFGDLRRLGIP